MGTTLQSLIIIFKFSGPQFGDQNLLQKLICLEDLLMEIVTKKDLGYLEDNAFRPDSCTLIFKSPDVNELLKVIIPLIKKLPPPPGSFAIKRSGDIGSQEQIIDLF